MPLRNREVFGGRMSVTLLWLGSVLICLQRSFEASIKNRKGKHRVGFFF